MKQWEYLLVDVGEETGTGRVVMAMLNRYGREGWSLVSAYVVPSSHPKSWINRLWFKRRRKHV